MNEPSFLSATRTAYDTVAEDCATPLARLPDVFAVLRRVLAPGGHLLLAFQVGDACVRLEQAYGHAIALDACRLARTGVVEQLGAAGLVVDARLVREPTPPEKTRQAYLLARRPTEP